MRWIQGLFYEEQKKLWGCNDKFMVPGTMILLPAVQKMLVSNLLGTVYFIRSAKIADSKKQVHDVPSLCYNGLEQREADPTVRLQHFFTCERTQILRQKYDSFRQSCHSF